MATDAASRRLTTPPDRKHEAAQAAPALLQRALRGGGTFADVFYEHTVGHDAQARWHAGRNSTPKPLVTRRTDEGLGVRVLDGMRCGFACAEGHAPDAWLGTAEAASLNGAAQLKPASFDASNDHSDLPADTPDTISETEKQALLREAIDAVCVLDRRIQRVDVRYHDQVRRTLIATSEGRLVSQAVPVVALRVAVTLATGQGHRTAYAMTGCAGGFGHFFKHPPTHLARDAVARAQHLEGATAQVSGEMPVVLAAGWGGVWLHEAIGHALEADTGLLDARLGERIAPEHVTLVDDATLAGGRGTFAFDDEGTPASRTLLIDRGLLRNRLSDRRHGPRSTGNARRQSYRHTPLPRMTNLLLRGGSAAPDGLIGGVRDGLYVRAVGNGQVQPGTGFSFEVLAGARIEDGRLTQPVAGVRIVGNGLDSLRSIAGVGRDVQLETGRGWCEKAGQVVPVSVGMPTVLLRRAQVICPASPVT